MTASRAPHNVNRSFTARRKRTVGKKTLRRNRQRIRELEQAAMRGEVQAIELPRTVYTREEFEQFIQETT
ncbi:MAG: hypothetical protein ACOC8X_09605 [Chloroflexota bacterium]